MDELRLSLRRLRKHPAAALASIVTLACGIGAAAATWSLLSALLLRPLAVHEPEDLVVVGVRSPSRADPSRVDDGHTYPVYPVVRDNGIFERVAAGGQWSLTVTTEGAAAVATVYFASHDFFDVLGVPLQVGRGFDATEDRRGAPPVAVLSDPWSASTQSMNSISGPLDCRCCKGATSRQPIPRARRSSAS